VNSRIVPIILTIVLVATSGAGGAWVGSRIFLSETYTHKDFHDRLFSEFKLTENQRALLEALEAQHAIDESALRSALKNAHDELARSLASESRYSEKIEDAVVNLHTAMLDLQNDLPLRFSSTES